VTDVSVPVGRARRVLWRRAGSEILAALPDESEIRRLGGSAAAIWVLLDAPRTVDELVGELGAAYDVPPEDIVNPVAGCVDELASLGLVEEVRQADG
jgi:hypothetical protein